MKDIIFAAAAIVLTSSASALAAPQPTVAISDFKYGPSTVTIHAGDTVRFVNSDQEAHTITASDGSFDSEGVDSGGSWTHRFTKPGRYTYFCELHPFMKGTIVVLPAGAKT
jgi:plastocyanin